MRLLATAAALLVGIGIVSPLAAQPRNTKSNAAKASAAPQRAETVRAIELVPDAPFLFPRVSRNQQRPGPSPVATACDTTCYCNKSCAGEFGSTCRNGGSDNCRNGLYCDTCSTGCLPANPC